MTDADTGSGVDEGGEDDHEGDTDTLGALSSDVWKIPTDDDLDSVDSLDELRETVRDLCDGFGAILASQAEFNASVTKLCETATEATEDDEQTDALRVAIPGLSVPSPAVEEDGEEDTASRGFQ